MTRYCMPACMGIGVADFKRGKVWTVADSWLRTPNLRLRINSLLHVDMSQVIQYSSVCVKTLGNFDSGHIRSNAP